MGRATLGNRYLKSLKGTFGVSEVTFRRLATGMPIGSQEAVIMPRDALTETGDQPFSQRGGVLRYVLYGDVDMDIEVGDTFAWGSEEENMQVEIISIAARHSFDITQSLVIDTGAVQ